MKRVAVAESVTTSGIAGLAENELLLDYRLLLGPRCVHVEDEVGSGRAADLVGELHLVLEPDHAIRPRALRAASSPLVWWLLLSSFTWRCGVKAGFMGESSQALFSSACAAGPVGQLGERHPH